jgi:hypothetical protein
MKKKDENHSSIIACNTENSDRKKKRKEKKDFYFQWIDLDFSNNLKIYYRSSHLSFASTVTVMFLNFTASYGDQRMVRENGR